MVSFIPPPFPPSPLVHVAAVHRRAGHFSLRSPLSYGYSFPEHAFVSTASPLPPRQSNRPHGNNRYLPDTEMIHRLSIDPPFSLFATANHHHGYCAASELERFVFLFPFLIIRKVGRLFFSSNWAKILLLINNTVANHIYIRKYFEMKVTTTREKFRIKERTKYVTRLQIDF